VQTHAGRADTHMYGKLRIRVWCAHRELGQYYDSITRCWRGAFPQGSHTLSLSWCTSTVVCGHIHVQELYW
jgi:hypothetical protein